MSEMENRNRKKYLHMICGGASGMTAKTLLAPLDRVKIILQLEGMKPMKQNYSKIWTMASSIVENEGILSLYRGNGANLIRVIPNAAIKFSLNDYLRGVVKKPDQKNLTFPQLIGTSSLAGIFQITCTYPLDFTRTRLAIAKEQLSSVHYTGIIDCLSKTMRQEGILAIYKGIVPSLLMGVPFLALQMSTFEFFKNRVFQDFGTGSGFMSGICAGFCALSLTYPGDTLRRRMKTNGIGGEPKLYSSTFDATRKIFRSEGWRGFFRGFKINTASLVPGVAIQLTLYDYLKRQLNI
jgi:hypothetical protein